MSKNLAGAGRKRPQLNIPVELLNLDQDNPRLARDGKGSTQLDLLSTLYSDFDIDEIAYSMSENGYFDEETRLCKYLQPLVLWLHTVCLLKHFE